MAPKKADKDKAAPKASGKAAPKAAGGKGGYAKAGAPPAKAAKSDDKKGAGKEDKAAKAGKKAMKASAEQQRKAQRDAMLMPSSDDETESSSEEAPPLQPQDGAPAKAKAAPSKKAAKEAEEEARQQARQHALRKAEQREAARKEEDEKARAGVEAARLEGERLQTKLGSGEKLSNKERRAYGLWCAKEQERKQEELSKQRLIVADDMDDGPVAEETSRWEAELSAFSVVLGGQPESDLDLSIEGFSISVGPNKLFSEANLKLSRERRYCLVGPNGKGKTVLLKHLACRKLPVPKKWNVWLVEQEAKASNLPVVQDVLSADKTRAALLEEEEELITKLEEKDVSQDIVQRCCARLAELSQEVKDFAVDAAEAKVRSILCGLGFSDEMIEGGTSKLSGGWRMRVSLAKALFLEPDLLLLDEPTNHLDLDAVLWLDGYLSTYPKTVLIVSHDAHFIDSVATDLLHLEEGKLVPYRSSTGVYSFFRDEHARMVRKREQAVKQQQKEIAKAGKKAVREEDRISKLKAYIVRFKFLEPFAEEEGIQVRDAAFSYTGSDPWLLSDVNVGVVASSQLPSRVAIVGRNGSGKTTLLKLMTGSVEPCEGEVEMSRRLTLGFYSQHFEELRGRDEQTPVDVLASAGIKSQEDARKCLGTFGLPGEAHLRPINELSGGQRARVVFASITNRRPNLLIMDEPTNHLDIESVEALIEALQAFQGAVVLVSHDARLIQQTECQLWVCANGKVETKDWTFEKYHRRVMTELQVQQARQEAMAAQRAAERQRRRERVVKT